MVDTRSRCQELLHRQKLSQENSLAHVMDLLEHEFGIQSQIFSHSLLAIQCRLQSKVSLNEIKSLMEDEKKIIRTWSLRGTLHLMRTADAAVMWSAFGTEWMTRWGTYLKQHVTEYDKQLVSEAVLSSLSDGPKTREQLKADLNASLKCETALIDYLLSPWGGILKDLSYKRMVIHGNPLEPDIAFHLTSSWLQDQPDIYHMYDQEEALGLILLRYLQAYGPARAEDFAYWSGITVTLAKKILKNSSADLISIGDLYDNKNIYRTNSTEAIPAVKLLPKFDPLLLGHKEKFYMESEYYKKIYGAAGHVHAAVLINGMIAGTWKVKGKKVDVCLFGEGDGGWRAELSREAEKTASFFNQSSPLHRAGG
ncbi:winged helix DNA-binding domain-containing protein [Paenibacillus dendritiformis]|nr:winged helix DNA-binding domain-containing protein [Paenibacillus dendritiformis]